MFSLIKKESSNLVNQDGKDIGLKQLLLVVGLLLSATNFDAHAVLIPYNSNGVDLVYSSVSDVTWTKDANLLGAMINSQGYNNIVNAIIAASPTITNTPNIHDGYKGIYNVSASDFDSFFGDGRTTWFGAMAFTSYLNSINYGGSDQWRLPSAGTNPQGGYNQAGSELGQLYYTELGGTEDSLFLDTPVFNNETYKRFWSVTEYLPDPYYAWGFNTRFGHQIYSNKVDSDIYVACDFGSCFYNNNQIFAWAVSPGEVPVPGAVWLMGSGLIGLLGLKRRGYAR